MTRAKNTVSLTLTHKEAWTLLTAARPVLQDPEMITDTYSNTRDRAAAKRAWAKLLEAVAL